MIVTLEEHQRAGGFGSAVLEAASRLPNAPRAVRVLGVPDRFVEHMTTREEQLADAGLDADGLERTVRTLLLAQAGVSDGRPRSRHERAERAVPRDRRPQQGAACSRRPRPS